MKRLLTIIIIVAAVIAVAAILFRQGSKNSSLKVTGSPGPQEQGQEFPSQGGQHIAVGASHESYNSNPPTSGPHYEQAADWGVYANSLPDEQVVHNLEHGGIWISYKDVDQQTKSQLEAIAKANPGVILTPRPSDDSKIALASWTRLEKLDGYDQAKILEFIRDNKNKSPEPITP